jgi:hypothetical protein
MNLSCTARHMSPCCLDRQPPRSDCGEHRAEIDVVIRHDKVGNAGCRKLRNVGVGDRCAKGHDDMAFGRSRPVPMQLAMAVDRDDKVARLRIGKCQGRAGAAPFSVRRRGEPVANSAIVLVPES